MQSYTNNCTYHVQTYKRYKAAIASLGSWQVCGMLTSTQGRPRANSYENTTAAHQPMPRMLPAAAAAEYLLPETSTCWQP